MPSMPEDAWPRLVIRVAAAIVGGGAALALAGWMVDSPTLMSVVPGLVAMNPLTATLFLALAGALLLADLRRGTSQATLRRTIAAASALAAATCVASYLAGARELGLDYVIYGSLTGENRMAPSTAVLFVMLGLALAVYDLGGRTGRLISENLTLLVVGGSGMSLVGYAYGAQGLYRIGPYIPMALNTAGLFLAASLGGLVAYGPGGVVDVVASRYLGGAMARRILPAGIAIPVVLGLLRVAGQRAGFYESEFGAALMVVVTTFLLTGAVAITASRMNRIDAERIDASDALRRSAAEYQDLYDSAPCGYHSLDARGMITTINATELAWLEYEAGELVGQVAFADLLDASCRAAYRQAFAALLEGGTLCDLELTLVRRDGSRLPVAMSAKRATEENGQGSSFRCCLFDITERKRAEEQIVSLNRDLERRVKQRTAELAAVNRDLLQKNQENEMFVYSVSHDLRTPLVSLQGFSKELELVGRELAELLSGDPADRQLRQRATQLVDEEMPQSLRFIQSSVMRLSGIIDALLRLSRVGRVEYDRRTVDMNEIVGRVRECLAGELEGKQVQFEVAALPACQGDPTAVEQLFANLLGNAVKYLNPARPGRIEVGVVEEGADLGDRTVTYFVRDNGLGIPSAYHEKIFTAFQRVHVQHAPGEGMGLAIVRRIAERHGGQVRVESCEDSGTTFYVTLPAAAAVAVPASLASCAIQGGSPCPSNL